MTHILYDLGGGAPPVDVRDGALWFFQGAFLLSRSTQIRIDIRTRLHHTTPMKTLVAAAQKGGAGKTTLCLSVAVAASEAGRSVIMLDMDPQQSLKTWWKARQAEDIGFADVNTADRFESVLKRINGKYDILIVDTPPSRDFAIDKVLDHADLALIPVRPSPVDLAALSMTLDLCRKHAKDFLFVPSQVPPRARLSNDAIRAMAARGKVSRSNLGQRVAYAEASLHGLSAAEHAGGKCRSETEVLWHHICELIEE